MPKLNTIYATKSGLERWSRAVDELRVVGNVEGGATLCLCTPGESQKQWFMDKAHTQHLIALLQAACE